VYLIFVAVTKYLRETTEREEDVFWITFRGFRPWLLGSIATGLG
jgi:hypothetical protein